MLCRCYLLRFGYGLNVYLAFEQSFISVAILVKGACTLLAPRAHPRVALPRKQFTS